MLRIDDLKNFGFKEFSDQFLQKMKEGFYAVIDASRQS
jgi:hypothetical protein